MDYTIKRHKLQINTITFNNKTATTPIQITNAFNKQFTDTIHLYNSPHHKSKISRLYTLALNTYVIPRMWKLDNTISIPKSNKTATSFN